MPAEDPAEIQGIFIPHDGPDLRDIIIRSLQEHLRVCDASGHNILHGRGVGILPEMADKPAHAHSPGRRVILDADVCIVMIIKIQDRLRHLPVHIFIPRRILRGQAAVDLNQELPEQNREKLLIMPLAALQLQYHLLKNPGIFQRRPGLNNPHIIRNPIRAQDIPDIASRKMNPIDLGLIHPVIHISLRLPWPVDHHLPGCDNGGLFLFIKIEIRLAGYNIQKLEIQAASGAVRGETGARVKMVGPAASYDQGFGFVFEIDEGVV